MKKEIIQRIMAIFSALIAAAGFTSCEYRGNKNGEADGKVINGFVEVVSNADNTQEENVINAIEIDYGNLDYFAKFFEELTNYYIENDIIDADGIINCNKLFDVPNPKENVNDQIIEDLKNHTYITFSKMNYEGIPFCEKLEDGTYRLNDTYVIAMMCGINNTFRVMSEFWNMINEDGYVILSQITVSINDNSNNRLSITDKDKAIMIDRNDLKDVLMGVGIIKYPKRLTDEQIQMAKDLIMNGVNYEFINAYGTVAKGEQSKEYCGAMPYDPENFDGIDLFVMEEISYGRYIVKENSYSEIFKQLISHYNLKYKGRSYS